MIETIITALTAIVAGVKTEIKVGDVVAFGGAFPTYIKVRRISEKNGRPIVSGFTLVPRPFGFGTVKDDEGHRCGSWQYVDRAVEVNPETGDRDENHRRMNARAAAERAWING